MSCILHVQFIFQMQYAKTNMDNVQSKLTDMGAKAKWLWEEINRDEEDEEMEYVPDERDNQNDTKDKMTLGNLVSTKIGKAVS